MSEKHGGVDAVDRAFAILAAFRDQDRSLTLAELGRRTGLYKSTILRLIESIDRAGFIRRLEDGSYAVGASALHVGRLYQASFDLDRFLLPVLQDLARTSGETASFYVRDRDRRVCLRRVEPDRAIRMILHEGDRLPLELGSAGKVLLAFGKSSPKMTTKPRPSPAIATRGEREPEAASISVPVFRQGNELAGALSLSGPIDRFDEAVTRQCTRLLLAAAANLSENLGGDAALLRTRTVPAMGR
jgi:DNA-binding IclR family transcriptional regulator